MIEISAQSKAGERPRQTQGDNDHLTSQVDSLTRLHELAMHLGGIAELKPALHAILSTAVEAQGAALGAISLFDEAGGTVVLEASHGFTAAFLEQIPLIERGSTFASKLRGIVEDIEIDPAFAPWRDAARLAGFRAVHSVPIVTRANVMLGVLNVYFAAPRRPALRDMQVADVCARHAADAVEAYRAQEALRGSEQMYRAIGDSMDYGVWSADAQGRTIYLSDSYLKLIGATLEECVGSDWAKFIHPEDATSMGVQWQRCVRDGTQWDHEFRVKGVDGQWHAILGRAVPQRNAHGEVTGWAGINLDIGRLKRVESELRELDQRKNEFLATLAHELRNPLAPLRNGLEVMRLASSNAQTVEKARLMMERQLGQMVHLVDDLLDVSRVSRGKIELRRENVELDLVLRNALETSQPLMVERRHEVVCDIPPSRIIVNADVTRLAQVFWNLLNNAAKYTEPGGRIELCVRQSGEEAVISIKDDGIGIPREMQGRIFDIFTQVDRALEKSQGGLGIGLSIARRLVLMHGGTIEVKSEGHGTGTEFIVRLPARLEALRKDGSDTHLRPLAAGPKHRILIADDNVDSASTLSLMLEVMGNEVLVANDGQAAVDLAATFCPDTILMDIGMPRLNGYEACEKIRGEPWGKGIYMVALTGWGQDEDRIRSAIAGFDRHLVKPVEPATLERMIQGLPTRGTPPSKK